MRADDIDADIRSAPNVECLFEKEWQRKQCWYGSWLIVPCSWEDSLHQSTQHMSGIPERTAFERLVHLGNDGRLQHRN